MIRKIFAIGLLTIGLARANCVQAACDTSNWTGTPCPPAAPTQYALPSGALVVSNSAQLLSALAGTTARDIILENGVYSAGSAFVPRASHRLWARNLGQAKLTTAIEIVYPNVQLHGLAFQITSSSRLRK